MTLVPILSASLLSLSLVAGTAAAKPLWTLQPQRSVSLQSQGAVRSVQIDADTSRIQPQASQLELVMPDGSQVLAQLKRSEVRADDRLSWFGVLAGEPDSTVVLTREGPWLAGYISSAAGIFEISPSAVGTVLMQHDSARFPECGGDPVAPAALRSAPTLSTRAATLVPNDLVTEIDALIVFSPGSVTNLGGQPQAQTFAQSAVDLANQSYVNSQMVQRMRLAGVRFTSRADGGNSSSDLNWLSGNAEVAQWRNETYADVVSMVSEFSDSCGLGYLMTTNSAGFAGSAFQVSARSCAIGNLTYPHEHGHNMGFAHNPEDSNAAVAAYAYAHWVNGQFRTVMSYSTPCAMGCTRRPYFSNPDVSYTGIPTGVVDLRDNARAGDLTAQTVANFRDAPDLPAGTILRNGFE